MPPMLVLDFSWAPLPTDNPAVATPITPSTLNPTLSPLPTISDSPSSVPPLGREIVDSILLEACGDFRQELIIGMILSEVALVKFQSSLKSELVAVTSGYLTVDEVSTTAAVLVPVQQLLVGSFVVPLRFDYRLCFEIPSYVESSEQVATYLLQHSDYMSRNENRRRLEQNLVAAGFPVIEGSLSSATRLDVRQSDSMIDYTAVVAGSVVAAVVVLAGIVFYLVRYVRKSSESSKGNGGRSHSSSSSIQPVELEGEQTSETIPVAQAVLAVCFLP